MLILRIVYIKELSKDNILLKSYQRYNTDEIKAQYQTIIGNDLLLTFEVSSLKYKHELEFRVIGQHDVNVIASVAFMTYNTGNKENILIPKGNYTLQNGTVKPLVMMLPTCQKCEKKTSKF